eukprot:88831-Alexandrium_andersonii.AAC.1
MLPLSRSACGTPVAHFCAVTTVHSAGSAQGHPYPGRVPVDQLCRCVDAAQQPPMAGAPVNGHSRIGGLRYADPAGWRGAFGRVHAVSYTHLRAHETSAHL